MKFLQNVTSGNHDTSVEIVTIVRMEAIVRDHVNYASMLFTTVDMLKMAHLIVSMTVYIWQTSILANIHADILQRLYTH